MVEEMSRDVDGLSGTFGFSAWNNCDVHVPLGMACHEGGLSEAKDESNQAAAIFKIR